MAILAPSRSDIQSRLNAAQTEIFSLGVRRLALFGSVRRDAAHVGSDIDLLVECVPGQKSFDHLIALGDLLEDLLGHQVALATRESLSPFLKRHILAEAVDVIRVA